MYTDPELHQTMPLSETKRCRKFYRSEFDSRYRELLPDLSEAHRALLLANGSYRDLAEQFGIPLGTVRSRLHRARARLELLRQKADVEMPDDVPAAERIYNV
jgi:DNA-directed RNA polymerase specialized sigma24 family protein